MLRSGLLAASRSALISSCSSRLHARTLASAVPSTQPASLTPSPPPPPLFTNLKPSRFAIKRQDTYQVMADDAECTRLNMQNAMMKTLLGGNYQGQAQAVLGKDGYGKAVMDIGCGTGAWIIDMVHEFPKARFVGLDASPMQTWLLPAQATVSKRDVNELGLRGYENSFDMVNARMIAMGISDYPALVREVTRALRPGGMFHFQEWDFVATDAQRCVVDERANVLVEWMAAFRSGIQAAGGSIRAANELVDAVRTEESLEKIETVDVWVPIVPAYHGATAQDILKNAEAGIMRENIKGFIRAARNFTLKTAGVEEECVDLENEAIHYLTWAKEPIYLRVNCVWGYKT